MYTCLIPARGGSKTIPLKNIANVNGKPLIWWVLKAANDSIIDEIYVSTDSDLIAEVVNNFKFEKVKVISRSPEVSTDEASTESVMSEFYDKYKPEHLILIQPTSPLLSTRDINGAIAEYESGNYDSLLTLVRRHQFTWDTTNEICQPNYNLHQRPRRQDYGGDMVENGAFYITYGSVFDVSRVRLSGIVGYYEMAEYKIYEVDDFVDITIIEAIMKFI